MNARDTGAQDRLSPQPPPRTTSSRRKARSQSGESHPQQPTATVEQVNSLTERELLAAAIRALRIDVPVYCYELEGQATVVLHLYGHTEPVRWTWQPEQARA